MASIVQSESIPVYRTQPDKGITIPAYRFLFIVKALANSQQPKATCVTCPFEISRIRATLKVAMNIYNPQPSNLSSTGELNSPPPSYEFNSTPRETRDRAFRKYGFDQNSNLSPNNKYNARTLHQNQFGPRGRSPVARCPQAN